MNYVTNTFLLFSSSVRSKQLLCFVHRQGQKSEQKHTTKKFIEFHDHSPLLTMAKLITFWHLLSHFGLIPLEGKLKHRNNYSGQELNIWQSVIFFRFLFFLLIFELPLSQTKSPHETIHMNVLNAYRFTDQSNKSNSFSYQTCFPMKDVARRLFLKKK